MSNDRSVIHGNVSLSLLLSDDHLADLTWLGLRLDAAPDEVLRAVVHQALSDRRVHLDERQSEQVEDRIRLLRVKAAEASSPRGWTCPVCEVVGPEPCRDVLQVAATAAMVEAVGDGDLSPAVMLPVSESVRAITSHPGWRPALDAAAAHGERLCEPDECDECMRALSVLQINASAWGEPPR